MNHKYCPYCMEPIEEGTPCQSCGLTGGNYTPSPHHLPPGTVLRDRYLVGRVLGEGGFGITYIGCDLRLELKVAIKEYFPTDKATRNASAALTVSSYIGALGNGYEAGLQRFLNEAQTMARMDKQPVIVNVRDFFEDNNTAYIVMEYVEGTTFKDIVAQRGGRIPAGELLWQIEPLFGALSDLHAAGLIHRDISPENLMLENGNIRLLDFGCAREAENGNRTMTIALKQGYAPVEQYLSHGQGPWTDVYALATTIYFCLTGIKPPKSVERMVEDELIPPRKLGVDLTERQERALLRGMGVNQNKRFKSVREFYTALYEDADPIVLPRESSRNEAPKEEPVPETPAPVPAPETETETESWRAAASRWLREHRTAACGVAAGLALCVLLLVFLPKLLRGGMVDATGPSGGLSTEETDPGDVPGQGDAPGQGDVPGQGDDPGQGESPGSDETSGVDTLFENAVAAKNEEEFLRLLADPQVSSVAVEESVTLTKAVTVTKPVLVREGALLASRAAVTVSGNDAVLDIRGQMTSWDLLRTEKGGSVRVSGTLDSRGLVWLENREDLKGTPTGSEPVVFDEEFVFAGAPRAATLEEFNAALADPRVTAINIAGDIVLDAGGQETWYSVVSLRVLEGASLTVNGTLNPRSGLSNHHLYMADGRIVVNHGTMRAEVNNAAMILNDGEWTGGVWGYSDEKAGAAVNFGSFTVTVFASTSEGFVFYNAGNMLIKGPTGDFGTGGILCCPGDITVEKDGLFYIYADQNAELLLSGRLTIEEGGRAVNDRFVTVLDGGEVIVRGGFDNNEAVLWLMEGSRFAGESADCRLDGVVLLENDNDDSLRFTVRPTGACRLYCVAGGGAEDGADFLAQLADPDRECVVLNAPLTVDTDLTLDKVTILRAPLTMAEGAKLTVTGCLIVERDASVAAETLEVTGTKAAAILEGEAELGQLTADRACVFCGGAVKFGSLTVADSAAVGILDNGNVIKNAELTITGGRAFLSGWSFKSCRITIEEDGRADITGPLDGSTIVNRGLLDLSGGYIGEINNLTGRVENYGRMNIWLLNVSGTLINEGKLLGRMDSEYDSRVKVVAGGSFIGDKLILYDQTTTDWTQY